MNIIIHHIDHITPKNDKPMMCSIIKLIISLYILLIHTFSRYTANLYGATADFEANFASV